MKLKSAIRTGLLCAASATLLANLAVAGTSKLYGSTSAPVPIAHPQARTAATTTAIKPFKNYQGAQYGTGGVALRNRSEGALQVSGVTGAVKDAWVYWVYLVSPGVAPAPSQPITISRISPTGVAPRTKTLTGTLIGTGGDPCWGSGGNAVYRARVPVTLATGNGTYLVTLDPSAVGLTTGEDPWDGNVVTPLAEGASMVLIGTGSSNVSLFDAGIAGNEMSGGSFSYTIHLPQAFTGSPVLFDSWGADGQAGSSRADSPGLNGDTVTINGLQISGTGSGMNTDSDWNGSAGLPITQLWDDRGHDITAVFAPGPVPNLSVTISSPSDCLVAAGNIVSY